MIVEGKFGFIFSNTNPRLQSGRFVKVLRYDGGGEYGSREFADFCKHHGIEKQTTTRYTPKQNGVVERKNRTIMNMARSLLTTRKMSKD
jgi:transposase InsO family protein